MYMVLIRLPVKQLINSTLIYLFISNKTLSFVGQKKKTKKKKKERTSKVSEVKHKMHFMK